MRARCSASSGFGAQATQLWLLRGPTSRDTLRSPSTPADAASAGPALLSPCSEPGLPGPPGLLGRSGGDGRGKCTGSTAAADGPVELEHLPSRMCVDEEPAWDEEAAGHVGVAPLWLGRWPNPLTLLGEACTSEEAGAPCVAPASAAEPSVTTPILNDWPKSGGDIAWGCVPAAGSREAGGV